MEPHTIIPDNFKNIAEVDDAVEEVLRRGISAEIVSDLTGFEIPFLDRSYDLRRLLALKHVAHRNSNVSREKKEQYERNRAAVQSDENSTLHLEGFKHAFSQINAGSGNAFGEDKVHSFLDLGCAPGGFSTWVLENNRSASGVGITLSPEARGLRLQLDSRFHAQFQCSFDDVCRIAAGDIDIASVPAAGFDLVIAQATIMFKDDVRWNESIGLVYAQLLVAFQHLAQGGSLITSLRSRPLNWIVDVFRALDITFESVHAVNTQYQGRRPFVYVVCRGFRADPDEKNNYIHRLRACIEYLDNSEGPVESSSGGAANIPRLCGTQDEPIPDATYQDVLDLFEVVWQKKYCAIRWHYQRVLENRRRASMSSTEGLGRDRSAPDSPVSRTNEVVSWRSPPQTPTRTSPTEGSPAVWRSRRPTVTGAPLDSYQIRREQRNTGIDTLFNRRDGEQSAADRSGSWRRSRV